MSSPEIQVSKAADGKLMQVVSAGRHLFSVDAPIASGGDDGGPDPHDLLNAALGACTALTVTMVAQRRQIPLDDLKVTIAFTEADGVYRITRTLAFIGALSEEQKTYLTGIANKCPIHKALSGRFEISTLTAEA
ncbi:MULTISPECIES: OsmC family protein [Nevskia]|uniref:OsmC family protein n=1 Tax=Nevskia TaxID=64001 RepID=UPI0003B5A272|nr:MULTISPECIES: OsmC family protein [Nevskia]